MNTFKGFQSPTTVDTPFEFFDMALRLIDNLPELKAVGYVLRRTLSYDKQMDWITLSQFEKGVVSKDGRRIDYGIEMPRKSIIAGLQRAVEHGWLVKSICCPDCRFEVQPSQRKDRRPHQSEFVIPSHCPKCKRVLKGRERIYYGLHWENPPAGRFRRGGLVTGGNYPTARGSYAALQGVVTAGNPHMKYQEEERAVLIFLSQAFADAANIPAYEMSKKEQQKVSALLQEGFTPETIATVIGRVVDSKKNSPDPVHTMAYCLPAVWLEKIDRQPQLSESATERGHQPSTETPAVPVETTELFTSLAQGDTVFLTLLQRVQRMNAQPLNEEYVRLWRALCDETWVVELAQKFSVASGTVLVMQAVDAAIASGSITENFLASKMARTFLEGWRDHGRDLEHSARPRAPRRSRGTPVALSGLQYASPDDARQAEEERERKRRTARDTQAAPNDSR